MKLGPRPSGLRKRIPASWWTWLKLPGRFHVRKPSDFWVWRSWRLGLHPSLRARALKLAAAQIGYKESPAGSNHTKYGVWYGADLEPWCAIFVSWVLSHVGRAFKYAYVPYIVNDAKAGRHGLSTIPYGKVAAALKAGHVVLACYDWPGESPGLADHIGFVEKVLSSTAFSAIEGNTSIGNDSNGGEVMRRTRGTGEVQVFVLVSA